MMALSLNGYFLEDAASGLELEKESSDGEENLEDESDDPEQLPENVFLVEAIKGT